MSRFARLARCALVLGVLASLLVPAVPAAAATPQFSMLRTKPQQVEHNGVTYRLQMVAQRFAFRGIADESVSVTLRRTKDPDGSGPLRSTQELAWGRHDLDRGSVRIAKDVRSASVDTGDQLGELGGITYTFAPTGDRKTFCKGDGIRQAGRLTGSLKVRTKSAVGLIELGDVRAVAETVGGSCGEERPPTNGCMAGYTATFAFRSDGSGLLGVRFGKAGRARILAFAGRTIQAKDPGAHLDFSRMIMTVVPGDHVRLSRDLSSGTVKGAAGTFTPGKATFAGTGRLRETTERCGSGLRNVSRERRGTVSGGLRTRFDVGSNLDLRRGSMRAVAERVVVRRR